MKGEGFLLCIAQVGLTFAGFAGLIGVFRPSEKKWIPQEIAGLSLILEHTFAAVLLSLLPFPLFYLAETRMWSGCSFLMSAFFIVEAVHQWRKKIKLDKKGFPPRRPKLLYLTFVVPSLILFLLELINGFRWMLPSVYMFGLLWLLIAAGVQFLLFVSFFSASRNVEGNP